jgi:hypothetical protein
MNEIFILVTPSFTIIGSELFYLLRSSGHCFLIKSNIEMQGHRIGHDIQQQQNGRPSD